MLTKAQCERAYRKLWEHLTRGDGYQMFGYDLVTMEACHPGFIAARNRLRQMAIAAS